MELSAPHRPSEAPHPGRRGCRLRGGAGAVPRPTLSLLGAPWHRQVPALPNKPLPSRGRQRVSQPCEGPSPSPPPVHEDPCPVLWGSTLPIELPGGRQSALVGGQGKCWRSPNSPLCLMLSRTQLSFLFSRQDWANSSSLVFGSRPGRKVTLSLCLSRPPPPHPHRVSPLGMSPDLTWALPLHFQALSPLSAWLPHSRR